MWMKTVIATLNAKYIHSSLAVRLLYVANKDLFDVSFREYTIKEDIEHIASDLLSTGCNCIGLGVYIWNVTKTLTLVARLREMKPDVVIILGGPEVSYEPEFFLHSADIDFVVSGEGEFILGKLLFALEKGLPTNMDGVSSKGCISPVIIRADLDRLAALPSPYQLEEDRELLPVKMIYFETSRGCPYRCSYCLSSLERGVRYFPEKYITDNLLYLINHGARKIKFLDRTFNLNKQHTRQVFDFLLEQYRPGLSCQFEVYAELLDDETIDWLNSCLPERFFRFEIGIQSTCEAANRAVNRRQNFPLLSRNISRIIQGGKIGMHLDLIAGLPFETWDMFIRSFNDVFAFEAKEVQLGFLKMLRGTDLRETASRYGYYYDANAPYEVISNEYISVGELQRIHSVEHVLEKYWNSGRFSLTLKAVFDPYYKKQYFEFFDELAQYCSHHGCRLYGYQLVDLFRYLHTFLQSKDIDLFDKLREDYYNCFTVRPTDVFWLDVIEKQERKSILDRISKDEQFLADHHLTPYMIKKQTTIDKLTDNHYLLNVFLPGERMRLEYAFTRPVQHSDPRKDS